MNVIWCWRIAWPGWAVPHSHDRERISTAREQSEAEQRSNPDGPVSRSGHALSMPEEGSARSLSSPQSLRLSAGNIFRRRLGPTCEDCEPRLGGHRSGLIDVATRPSRVWSRLSYVVANPGPALSASRHTRSSSPWPASLVARLRLVLRTARGTRGPPAGRRGRRAAPLPRPARSR